MIPGPTEVSSAVREEMGRPMQPHYGPQWCELYDQVIDKLKQIFRTENDLYVLAATSSSTMELAVSHAVEPGESILICNNGVFGDRFTEMAEWHDARVITSRSEYGYPITGEQISKALQEHPEVKALAVVHNESSTAVESNLQEIMQAAATYPKVLTIVDCVSSMGGVDIPTDELGIDYCLSGSQKCFGAPAGLGFISVSPKAWERITDRREAVRGWYLNLSVLRQYREKWIKWHPQGPNTAPVSLYRALNQALDEILNEGLDNRFARHTQARDAFRAAVRAMGLELYVPDRWASRTLTAVCLPQGIDGSKLREKIEKRHHILLAGGLGATADTVVRVGHLARTATPEYLLPTIVALEEELATLGAKINIGRGEAAFREVFRQ